jgi:hypothetical protein
MEFLNDIHWRNGQPLNMKERNSIIFLYGSGLTPEDIPNRLQAIIDCNGNHTKY